MLSGMSPANVTALINDDRRVVPLFAVHNFRDLGGYPTADGRETRWRTLFRADGLYRLTPDDKFMHDLRVAVIDHRGNVRRLADLVNVDPEVATFWDVQIRKDLDYIFNEKDQETKKP